MLHSVACFFFFFGGWCYVFLLLFGGTVFRCFPLCCAFGVGAFLRLLAMVLPFSSKIDLNTVNKIEQSQARRSESDVITFSQQMLLHFRFFVFSSKCFSFFFFPFDFFCWIADFREGQ